LFFKKYKTIILSIVFTLIFVFLAEGLFLGKHLKSVLKLTQVIQLLDKNFYFALNEEDLVDYAITGMTLATEDEYTNYYSASDFKKYINSSQNTYVGIGVIIAAAENNENVEIISVTADSPSEKAGIKCNDWLIAINGEEVFADDLDAVAEKIRGKGEDIGKSVILTIKRNSELFEIEVNKSSIEKDTVQSKILFDDLGYIKINSFDRKDKTDNSSTDTFDEFLSEMKYLNDKNIKKLVIDLRNNPGGDLDVVSAIADYFLPECVITYTENKQGKKEYIYSDEECVDMEIVVLVNENSASASEILTGALKDWDKAEIVGTKTYGKGIVQTIFSLGDGSGMSVTTSNYYPPGGVCIHGIGIYPDYVIDFPEYNAMTPIEEDLQLQKAIEILKN